MLSYTSFTTIPPVPSFFFPYNTLLHSPLAFLSRLSATFTSCCSKKKKKPYLLIISYNILSLIFSNNKKNFSRFVYKLERHEKSNTQNRPRLCNASANSSDTTANSHSLANIFTLLFTTTTGPFTIKKEGKKRSKTCMLQKIIFTFSPLHRRYHIFLIWKSRVLSRGIAFMCVHKDAPAFCIYLYLLGRAR